MSERMERYREMVENALPSRAASAGGLRQGALRSDALFAGGRQTAASLPDAGGGRERRRGFDGSAPYACADGDGSYLIR